MFSSTFFLSLFLCIVSKDIVQSTGPQFMDNIKNITIKQGSDVKITCKIKNIGTHKVAWYHMEKKQVLAVHEKVTTNNYRMKVIRTTPQVWVLHIRSVRISDAGNYMCQINTVPMRQQSGNLNVVVAPVLIKEKTSSDISVSEQAEVKLSCKAIGTPKPIISWRRDDGSAIPLTDDFNNKQLVHEYRHEILHFKQVSRLHMGAYLCQANNGVNPPATKTILLNVNFVPMVWIPEQLIGASLGSKLDIVCNIEAFPKPITYWKNTTNNVITSSDRYVSSVIEKTYEIQMKLTILWITPADYGRFKCVAKNPLGETDGVIKIYEKAGPSKQPPQNRNDAANPDLPRNSPVMKNLVGNEKNSEGLISSGKVDENSNKEILGGDPTPSHDISHARKCCCSSIISLIIVLLLSMNYL